MIDITIDKTNINIEALDADLIAALPGLVSGISTGWYGVTVHLVDNATQGEIDTAIAIVNAHDSSVKTADQLSEEQRKLDLTTSQDANKTALEPNDYLGETALLQALVNKVAWLEMEIVDLRK